MNAVCPFSVDWQFQRDLASPQRSVPVTSSQGPDGLRSGFSNYSVSLCRDIQSSAHLDAKRLGILSSVTSQRGTGLLLARAF